MDNLIDLFHAAVVLAPSERAAYLQKVCGADVSLHKTVESLIEYHEQTGNFIDSPAYQAVAQLLTDSEDFAAGQTIAHYQILSVLGKGGMGKVYLAEDTKLKRKVALKMLPSLTAGDPAACQRFLREARAAAGLDHSNICAIYEVGEDDGHSYIAMQYIEGQNLDARMKRGPLSCDNALKIAGQVADALGEAHAHNIIHRDIKPANVMITSRDQVKVLDFGLAKTVDEKLETIEERETKILLTQPGVIVGTVPYMSPEQVRAEAVDARSDLFSFGVMLYEMLTGQRAFARDTAAETIAAILSHEPDGLATGTLNLPGELERILRKCLAKDREQRYQATPDLLIDLQNLQRHQTAEAPGRDAKSVAAESSKLPERVAESKTGWQARLSARHGIWLAASLATVLVAALIFVYVWQRRANLATAQAPINSLAVLPLDNLSGDPSQDYFADGMTEELNTELAKIGTIRVISRSSTMQYKGTHKTIQEIARELNVDAIVEGSVLRSENKVRINVQLFLAATAQNVWAESYERYLRDVLSLQDEVARGIADKIKAKVTPQGPAGLANARPFSPEAQDAYLKGLYYFNQAINGDRVEARKALHEKSFDYFQQAIKIEPNYAQAHADLARSYHWLASDDNGPPEFFPKAKEEALRALQIDETNATAHGALAWVSLVYEWDWVGAEKEFKRTLELDPNAGNAGHHGYAYLLSWEGRHEEAIREITFAEQLDPLVFDIKLAMGGIYVDARQYDRAIEKFKSILELRPNDAGAIASLAAAYAYKGMYDDAIAQDLKAIELTKSNPAKSFSLAWIYARAGRRSDALRILNELTKSEPDPHRPRAPWDTAKVYAALNEKELALSLLEQAIATRQVGLALKVSPAWDNVRDDPRFQDLLRRVGFPQ